MKKVRITKRALWVAKKPGQPNGYGDTPAAAFKDAEKRQVKAKALRTGLEDLEARKRALIADAANMQAALRQSMKAQIDRLAMLEKSQADDVADGWVMMACAVVGTTNTSTALAEMGKRGAFIGERERRAAARVDKFIANWTADMARGGPIGPMRP